MRLSSKDPFHPVPTGSLLWGNAVHWSSLCDCTEQQPATPNRVSWQGWVVGDKSKLISLVFKSMDGPKQYFLDLRCWVQGDNACKEVRNSYTGRWASLMCQANFFSVCGHHHMVVGHTHEDIGNRFVLQKNVSTCSQNSQKFKGFPKC